jgi:hypothetical protein
MGNSGRKIREVREIWVDMDWIEVAGDLGVRLIG